MFFSWLGLGVLHISIPKNTMKRVLRIPRILYNIILIGIYNLCAAILVFPLKALSIIGMDMSMKKIFRRILVHQCLKTGKSLMRQVR